MNRRSFLISGFQAAGAAALATSVPSFAFNEAPLRLHPAIQANIDYWMKHPWVNAPGANSPWHTSFYLVKEDECFRVYGVEWQGENLNSHRLFVPENESESIRQARDAIHPGMGINEEFETAPGTKAWFCSYVFDSPGRRIKKWQGSMATCLLAGESINSITPRSNRHIPSSPLMISEESRLVDIYADGFSSPIRTEMVTKT